MRPFTSFHTPSTSIDSTLLVSPNCSTVSSGVPKGSVLEPLVFLDDNAACLHSGPQSHRLPNSNCCLHHDRIPFFPPTASPSSFSSSSAWTSTRLSIHTCPLFFTSQPSSCPQIRLLHHLSIPSAWTWKLAFKLFSVCFLRFFTSVYDEWMLTNSISELIFSRRSSGMRWLPRSSVTTK